MSESGLCPCHKGEGKGRVWMSESGLCPCHKGEGERRVWLSEGGLCLVFLGRRSLLKEKLSGARPNARRTSACKVITRKAERQSCSKSGGARAGGGGGRGGLALLCFASYFLERPMEQHNF